MNIIELAERSGLKMLLEIGGMDKCLEHFAALVAAHEREECAKICDDMDSLSDYYTLRVELICAQAIRARNKV